MKIKITPNGAPNVVYNDYCALQLAAPVTLSGSGKDEGLEIGVLGLVDVELDLGLGVRSHGVGPSTARK